MKLLLNNKKTKIPTADNLTIAQYIALSKHDKIDIIKYIAAVTNTRVLDISATRISNIHMRRLSRYIGKILNVNELEQIKSKGFYFKDELYTKKLDWESVGVRMLFEQRIRKTKNNVELAVYLLSVLIEGNHDADNAEEIYKELQEYSYLDIMPIALFFFKKLMRGYRSDNKLLLFLRKAMSLITRHRSKVLTTDAVKS